jgi:hypothetical protein
VARGLDPAAGGRGEGIEVKRELGPFEIEGPEELAEGDEFLGSLEKRLDRRGEWGKKGLENGFGNRKIGKFENWKKG